jgi:nicotinamidase-related amidase
LQNYKEDIMPKRLKVHLVVIDPQNDFMDIPNAALPVTGATEDMKRVSKLIDRVGPKLTDIHVTLDSHRRISIERPSWWMDQDGKQPPPFTMILAKDVESGIWTPRNPQVRERTIKYLHDLEASPDNYHHMVWTHHCEIGSSGHNVYAPLMDSLNRWQDKEFANVDFVTKGSNPFTEHFGALMAEVPDSNDPASQLNTDFLSMMSEADIIGVAGEASSHCVLCTIRQIANNIGDEHLKKFHILTDGMSSIGANPGGPDFPAITKAFFAEMERRGMKLTTCADFLS